MDWNLYGHQLVTHLVSGYNATAHHNAVDGDAVPVPHCGAALSVDEFHALATRLRERGVQFVIEPHLRFQGMPGEQWTMVSDLFKAQRVGPLPASELGSLGRCPPHLGAVKLHVTLVPSPAPERS